MDDTSREFKKVHVAQPAFLASELLSVGIENFMQAGATSPRFLFTASKRAVIDHEEYFDKQFLKVLTETRRRFKAHHEQFIIHSKVGIRRLGNGALRFQIMPVDQLSFQQSLDEIDELPQYEGAQRTFIGPQRHFLQATVAGHLLGDNETTAKAASLLRERLSDATKNPLYTVRAHDLVESMAEIPIVPAARTI